MSNGSIGRFLLLGPLGEGGMGVVYAAYDPQLERKVAVKLVRSRLGYSTEFRTRLLKEAQAMARLTHPNVVSVYDVGTFEDDLFVAMEFVDGRTLREWLKEKWRPTGEVLDVFRAAGAGLAAAHAAGVIHRDFKASNVLVARDGAVKVSDFGLAVSSSRRGGGGHAGANGASNDTPPSRPAAGATSIQLSVSGGTPGYMAPEQVLGEALDARADQYSFCVALYEALTGVHPHDGPTLNVNGSGFGLGKLAKARAAPVLQRAKAAGVPSRVLRPLLRGLSPQPSERFESIDALLAALAEPTKRKWQTTAGRRYIVWGALSLLLGLIGLGAQRQLRGGNLAGASGFANLSGGSNGPQPPALRVPDVCGSELQLAWDAMGNGPYHDIERSTDGRQFTTIGRVGAGVAEFRDRGRPFGSYSYRVKDSLGGVSNTVSVTVGPIHIDHSNDFDRHDELQANGDARFIPGGIAQIVHENSQRGSFFTTQRVGIRRFKTRFTVRLHGGTEEIRDGFTFTMQSESPMMLAPVHCAGGLGYGSDEPGGPVTTRHSVAIKFDVYDNWGEGSNSTGIFTGGRSPTVREPLLSSEIPDRSVDLSETRINLRSPSAKQVDLSYDGTTLTESITDLEDNERPTFTTAYVVDIAKFVGGDTAFVGFTGATGQRWSIQDILSWTFDEQESGDDLAPRTPINVRVTPFASQDVTRTNVSVAWLSNNSYSASAFLLERSTDGTTFEQLARVEVPTTRFTDWSLVPGTYFYRVRSLDGESASAPSEDGVLIGDQNHPVVVDHSRGFANHEDLISNGTTSFQDTFAILTSGQRYQAGSLFSKARLPISGFSTAFTFQIRQGSSTRLGDGMTFTIQGNSPIEVGTSGSGMGFETIGNSVAIKFDAYNHKHAGTSTGLYSNGRHPDEPEPNAGDILVDLTGTGIDLRSLNIFAVEMDYDGVVLRVTITDTGTMISATQTYSVDIGARVNGDVAFVGFTGATGRVTSIQEIRTWTFRAPQASCSSTRC